MSTPPYRVKVIAEPAPQANPDGRIDGAWRIMREHTLKYQGALAYFTTDGRDACESWAYSRRWAFVVYRDGTPVLARDR